MSGARVLWTEGMFLRPQHFQQQDRWAESLVRGATDGLRDHGWGFRTFEVESGLLAKGQVGIRACTGILPDGTPFDIPGEAPAPPPLSLPPGLSASTIWLALPHRLPGAPEVDAAGPNGARYRPHEASLRDSQGDGGAGEADIQLARPCFRLLHELDARDAYAALPVARVSLAANGTALLAEPEFAPPALRVDACPWVRAFLEEVEGTLAGIAAERAAFVTGKRPGAAADLADFLILQLCNRALATARHLNAQGGTHPAEAYLWLAGLVSEAATFIGGGQAAPVLEPYRHGEPWLSFRPLFAEARRALLELARPERKAIAIPLRFYEKSRVRAAEVGDRGLYNRAAFIVAVKAPYAADQVRQRLPNQVKIGPVEELQAIIQAAVPGIPLHHLPTAPQEIPVRRDMVYFELDRHNDYWRRLPSSAGLAIHVTGEMGNGLEMECWAIQG